MKSTVMKKFRTRKILMKIMILPNIFQKMERKKKRVK